MNRLFLLQPRSRGENNRSNVRQDTGLLFETTEMTGEVESAAEQSFFWIMSELILRLAEADVSGFRLAGVAPPPRNGPATTYPMIEPLGYVLIDESCRVQSWSGHDICRSPSNDLVVTEKALTIFRQARVENCRVTPLT